MGLFTTINEVLNTLGSTCGTIMSIIALIALVGPKTRNKLAKWTSSALKIDEINEKMNNQIQLEKKRNEERLEHEKKQQQTISEIKDTLNGHIEEYKIHNENDRERDIFFLRTEIDNIYHKFVPLGYITTRAKSDVLKAFELYQAMGGNSYAKDEIDELLELPTKLL